MKIVILDKNTTTSNGDISFDKFKILGEIYTYDNLTKHDEIITACQNANVIILNKVQMNNELIIKTHKTKNERKSCTKQSSSWRS